MQRIINVLALSSFLVSAAAVGGGVYLYLNKDSLVEKVKGQIMESVTDSIPGALVGGLGGSMVSNPSELLSSPSEALTEPSQVLPFSPF